MAVSPLISGDDTRGTVGIENSVVVPVDTMA